MLIAASGLLAVFILGTLTFLILRWGAFRHHVAERSHANARLSGRLDALADQAGRTADRIRAGNPLRGEVIRCYREMDRLLSRVGRFTPTYHTPREFASSLCRHGIDSESVHQLTELFELVRYGARDDTELAERALTCLDQIERLYGKRETGTG